MKLSLSQKQALNIRLKDLEKKNGSECEMVRILRVLLDENTSEDKIKDTVEKLEEKIKTQDAFKNENEIISAISLLGFCYKEGLGVTQNLERALELLRQAAKQGDAAAQNELGICYLNGFGVKANLEQSVEWLRKAAEQGHVEAQMQLADWYQWGIGVEKDLKQAAEWCRRAAEQGNARAQNNLGYFFRSGVGVEKDLKKADEWYRKAAEQGYALAQNSLGSNYRLGIGVKKDLKQAAEWYRKAVEQGDVRAQHQLAYCYQQGEGVEKDLKQAFELLQQASLQQYDWAQYDLGVCYLNGTGVVRDLNRAALLLKMASSKGFKEATSLLRGDLFSQVPALELKEAYHHYTCEQNHPILGFCCWFGLGVGQDLMKACEHYIQAIDQFEEIVKTRVPEVIVQHFNFHIYRDLFFVYQQMQANDVPLSKEEYAKFYKGLETLEKNEKLSLSIKKQLVLCIADMYERRGPFQNLIKASDYYLKHEKYCNAADTKTGIERKMIAEANSAGAKNNDDWAKKKRESYKNLPAYQKHIEKICGEVAAFPGVISSIVTEYAFDEGGGKSQQLK